MTHSDSASLLDGTVVRTTSMVAMRDGTLLATDIYLPKTASHALPVLLERTPYGKTMETRRERSLLDPRPMNRGDVAARFAREGYAVVVQDCRGRYDSQGVFTKYLGEANDGADTMAWLIDQAWCNGSIGTYGLSYAAHTQSALATQKPRGLKAMFMECGGFANAYRGGIRHGGAFELKQATWAFRNAQNGITQTDAAAQQALASVDLGEWFKRLPWSRGDSPLQWAPEYEEYLFDQWERGNFDDYWRQPELYAAGHYDAFEGIPVMLMCGWWDPYAQTTTDNFAGLSAARTGYSTHLVLGPWTHGERSVSFAGDVDFGPAATLDGNLAEDYVQMRLGWFDRWLKNAAPARDDASVRYFRMGGGSGARNAAGRMEHGGVWQSAEHWPLPQTQFTPWFLQADGSLSPHVAQNIAERSFEFDPARAVPTIGGSITSGEPLMFAGAYDQRTDANLFGASAPFAPLAERGDVLVFESAVLQQDVEITGPIHIHLWISSSAPDTDFTAKLVDLYPPSADYPQGFAMNITDGIMRCRYRDSWESPQLMTPGEVVEIKIEPMPTSNLFRKGHRIRLDISSSNFPRFDVNPNTGAPEGSAGERVVARNCVHLSKEYPSHVLLPIIAADGMEA